MIGSRLFRSLAVRAGAAIVLIELAVLAVVGVVFQARFAGQVDRRIQAQLQLPGTLINAGLLRFDSVADRRTMARIIEGELVSSMVVGVDGTVFYSLDPSRLGKNVTEIAGLGPAMFRVDQTETRVIRRGGSVVCVSPIYGADGVTPRFFTYVESMSTAAAREKAEILWFFVSGTAIAVLLTSAFVILWFRHAILKRFKAIAATLRRVESGDLWAQVDLPPSADEIGALQDGVDSMANQLAHTIDYLESEIGERARAEEELHASETRYRTLVESFRDIVYILSLERRILFANPAMKRITGFDFNELDDHGSMASRIHADDIDRVRAFMTEFMQSDRHYSGRVESRFLDRDGRQHWFSSSLTKISYNGEPALQVVARDITERKLAEQALITREKFLSSLSQVSLWLVERRNPRDVLGRIVALLGETAEVSCATLVENVGSGDTFVGRRSFHWCSAGGAGMVDHSGLDDFVYAKMSSDGLAGMLGRGELVAAHVRELEDGDRGYFEDSAVTSILAAPLLVSSQWHGFLLFEERRTEREWQYEVDLLRIATAEIAGAMENGRLFDEVQGYALEMADRVAERTAELEHLNRELSSFAYSVSHDLRAPLRSIDGFSEILLEDYPERLDPRGRDLLQRIRASSQRMGLLIDQLLELSRVNRRELVRTTVDLSDLTRRLAEELRHVSRIDQVEVVVADRLEVEADPGLLTVVMQNLLENAFKFSSRTSAARIEVGASTGNGATAYFVRDNGAGFDMRYADKLFGVFQRLHADHEFEGTGIGLATVQRIIERHGGRIWAEGVVGEGACFYFTLSD